MTQLAKAPAAPNFGAYQSTYAAEAKRLAEALTSGVITATRVSTKRDEPRG